MITNYNLIIFLSITSILFILPSFLLSQCIQEKKLKKWVFLLALTSPLFISFSFQSFWDTPWLLIISVIILYIVTRRQKQNYKTAGIIGIFLGISFGSHIQSIPFIAGFIIWYFWKYRDRKKIAAVLITLLITLIPYFVGLYQIRSTLHFRMRISSQILPDAPLVLFTSIFRYWGLNNEFIVNHIPNWQFIEIIIAWVSVIFRILFVLLFIIFLYKTRKNKSELHEPLVSLSLAIIPIFLILSFISHGYTEVHETMMIWWFAPFFIPILIYYFFPKKAKFILSVLIVFNIVAFGIQYLPRLKQGTTILYPHGPSWWMEKKIVEVICANNNQKRTKLLFADHQNTYILHSLLGMIALQNPSCISTVVFSTGGEKFDYLLKPDSQNREILIIKSESLTNPASFLIK